MSVQLTLAEIAEALGVHRTSALRRSERESWPFSEESVIGGKQRLYLPADLPADVRAALLKRAVYKLSETVSAPECDESRAVPVPAEPAPMRVLPVPTGDEISHATDADRAQRMAALQVLGRVDQIAASANCSIKAACNTLINSARAGMLPGALVATLRRARDNRGRPSPDGLPSARSLERWIAEQRAGGSLLPRKNERDMTVLPWYALAVALKQRPQKPTTKWIHEQIVAQWDAAWGEAPPSYDVVYRFFRDKFSQVEQLKGQHLGSSLRAHLFYQHRSAAGLAPFVEVHADGWNTHFTAPHPVTGEFVTYEVWHAHDVATRYVTPPSIGLTESFEVIAKCIELAIRVGGVMAVLQTDSTGSVKNARMEFDPVTSIAERGGFTIVHPKEVGNSQANGIAENFNTYLDRESRELATYQGKHMDSLALKRVKKLTEKMVKAARAGDMVTAEQFRRKAAQAGKGLVFESYDHAVAWLHEKFDKFNASPHSSLPKISDPMTGKRRHQTPAEALQEARDAGWAPVMLDEASVVDLFRPHVRKTVRRGTVSPFGGQRYHHADLPHYEGQEVQVAIDIMDWRSVWVKDLQGRVICEAAFVEATGFRALSMYEYALEKRMNAQVRRKENQIEQITERMAPAAIDAPAVAEIDIAMHLYGEPEPVIAAVPAALPEAAPTAPVTAAPSKAAHRHNDMTDIAMYLYGDQLDEAEDRDDADFKAAVG